MTVKNCKLIHLQQFDDGIDGCILVAESLRHIPFKIKRVYYISNLGNKNAIRGKHAHKKLEQVIFCINGSFLLRLDDGKNKKEIVLDKLGIGIYLGVDLWHTMTQFSKDCILLVLASDYYKESDYIRDYMQFIEYIKNKK